MINRWGPNDDLPLEMALHAQNLNIANTLIQHNANINVLDKDGENLIHRAIRHLDHVTVHYLIEHDCSAICTTRSQNENALHLVANAPNLMEGDQIAQNLIVKCGLDPNAQNRYGSSPLQISIQADNRPVFNTLLQSPTIPIDLNQCNNDGYPALYYAFVQYENGGAPNDFYMRALLNLHTKLNLSQLYGSNANSLLQILIVEDALNSALVLIDYLTDDMMNHLNALGEGVLHMAVERNALKLVENLLDKSNTSCLTYDTRQSVVHYAVKAHALDVIPLLIDRCDFNTRDVSGETPLSLAFRLNHNQLIPILIKGGADINVRNNQDLTLFHQAIVKGDGQMALFLLENGADMNAKTADSETALQLAIRQQLPDVVEALCLHGVDMSAMDQNGNCPLWLALCAPDGSECALILVKHGVDTDFWTPSGPDNTLQTLLHRAIDENNDKTAIFLIQSGCELDEARRAGPNPIANDPQAGYSPLHLCCEWGLLNIARTLIEHRANINARSTTNTTPIHVAIENQQIDLIQLLLSVPEIDLSLKDRNGLSPFAVALACNNLNAAKMVHEKMPSAAEQYDNRGYNFLHRSIVNNELANALFLLSLHVDANARVQDAMCTPALHLAAKHCNDTIIRSLILMSAWVDERDARKRTAIHIAAEAGNQLAVVALLHNNVDFQALDAESNNALHIAVRAGHLSVVRALLAECAIDAEAVNLKGRNPLHELCKFGRDNAAAIFDLFLETMPKYPIDRTDINGNSPLLLAYMNGNGKLCRALVKGSACLATENQDRISIFNYQVASRQLLHSLLDQLSQPAVWAPKTDSCQECGKQFSITVRTHHCRHCGRGLCARCSDQEVPIVKFGEHKPVRVCHVCFDVLKTGGATM